MVNYRCFLSRNTIRLHQDSTVTRLSLDCDSTVTLVTNQPATQLAGHSACVSCPLATGPLTGRLAGPSARAPASPPAIRRVCFAHWPPARWSVRGPTSRNISRSSLRPVLPARRLVRPPAVPHVSSSRTFLHPSSGYRCMCGRQKSSCSQIVLWCAPFPPQCQCCG